MGSGSSEIGGLGISQGYQQKPEDPCDPVKRHHFVPRRSEDGDLILRPTGAARSVLGSVFGKLWNGVNSTVGLLWGGIGVLLGAKVSLGHNAIQFEDHPLTFSAITLGNTISYGKGVSPDVVGAHEEQHTYQGELLGPLYLPSNILGGLSAELHDGCWHGDTNWNEAGPQAKEPSEW